MRKFLTACLILAAPLLAGATASWGEEGSGLDDLFGILTDDGQTMEDEDVSTASAIRGLNPVAEKYGASRRDLARFVPEVRRMERRRITRRELRKFLNEAGLRGGR